jgi:hypothetical protein
MAIKTFTTGELLTASDTNTYLANSGLVFIKQQTIGNAVTSVVVTDAFSATYDAYQFIVTGGTASGNGVATFRLGTTATANYYYAGAYYTFAGVPAALNGSAVNQFSLSSYNVNHVGFDVFVNQPFLAKNTSYATQYIGTSTTDGSGNVQGFLNNTTSYTSFEFFTSGGQTFTGGTVTVYGYRKA